MMKLLLGRLLPGGLAVGLLTGALSPIKPALDAFAIAANALGGEANAGGVDMPDPDEMVAAATGQAEMAGAKGFFNKLFGKKGATTSNARREIEGLAEALQESADARAAENIAKMGKKDKGDKSKGDKPKGKGKSKPEVAVETTAPGPEAGKQ